MGSESRSARQLFDSIELGGVNLWSLFTKLPPNLPESTLHDRHSRPRRHRPPPAEDLPRRRSVRARADGGDQRRAPPRLRNARLCRSADPRPVRRPRVIRKRATAAVPRGAAERQIPIAPPRRRTLAVPRFPPLEALGRRPSGQTLPPASGPASETLRNSGRPRIGWRTGQVDPKRKFPFAPARSET